MIEPGFLGDLKRKGLVEDLCFSQQFANANTFLCETSPFVSYCEYVYFQQSDLVGRTFPGCFSDAFPVLRLF